MHLDPIYKYNTNLLWKIIHSILTLFKNKILHAYLYLLHFTCLTVVDKGHAEQ